MSSRASRAFCWAISAIALLGVTACTDSRWNGDACDGTRLEVPAGGATIPQLMAHATAMGMSQREAETLLYLEGLNPQATVEPGQVICLDGRPD